ncbi:MAG: nicotinate (nicotinamide) nucleotide adenylyltransferase [Deltaproteobacteria bacterium]|nr:nicotinate (nicotinamide) nucleotide adenylyltransferase [Deltaproteobacteria bacterium]
MRLGILGGTFDPIHLGHLRLAEEMCEEINLSKILLIPGAQPPHKDGPFLAPFIDRLEMTRLAAEYSDYLEACDIEGLRKGPSYSIETIRIIREKYRNNLALYFILGSDAFKEINTWKEYKDLFRITNFVVIERPGIILEEMGTFIKSLGMDFKETGAGDFSNPYGNHVLLKKSTLMAISSTKIRQAVREGKSINFIVPQKVKEYIIRKELYK